MKIERFEYMLRITLLCLLLFSFAAGFFMRGVSYFPAAGCGFSLCLLNFLLLTGFIRKELGKGDMRGLQKRLCLNCWMRFAIVFFAFAIAARYFLQLSPVFFLSFTGGYLLLWPVFAVYKINY